MNRGRRKPRDVRQEREADHDQKVVDLRARRADKMQDATPEDSKKRRADYGKGSAQKATRDDDPYESEIEPPADESEFVEFIRQKVKVLGESVII